MNPLTIAQSNKWVGFWVSMGADSLTHSIIRLSPTNNLNAKMRSAQCFWVPKHSSNRGPKPGTHSGSSAIGKANLRFEERRRKWWARRSRRGRARARRKRRRGRGAGRGRELRRARGRRSRGRGAGSGRRASARARRRHALHGRVGEERRYFAFAVGNGRIWVAHLFTVPCPKR